MLEYDIIEYSNSFWSFFCIFVFKLDGLFWFCIDFCKVNVVIKIDFYFIFWIEDCIDKIGCVKYVSKFDFLKGYW